MVMHHEPSIDHSIRLWPCRRARLTDMPSTINRIDEDCKSFVYVANGVVLAICFTACM